MSTDLAKAEASLRFRRSLRKACAWACGQSPYSPAVCLALLVSLALAVQIGH